MLVVVIGTGHSQTCGHSTLDDRYLVYLVLSRQVIGSDRMAGLMVGGDSLVTLGDDTGLLLRSGDDLHGGLLDVALSDGLAVISCSKESGFVQQVLKICAGEALSRLSDDL